MQFDQLKRRDFITLLGGAAAAWPLAARAQQAAMPVVGFLLSTSAAAGALTVSAFRQGLKEAGYIEGQNVTIEFRFAESQIERLPGLAADLIRRQVTVIFAAGGGATARAAKAATSTIPIVFANGEDPVKIGLVPSLSRPNGNITGVTFFSIELGPKRLELLRELVPGASTIALLVNPRSANAESGASLATVEPVIRAGGQHPLVLEVADSADLAGAFTRLVEQRAGALQMVPDPMFYSLRTQIAALATRHGVPTIFPLREFVTAGGLASYGASSARRRGVRQEITSARSSRAPSRPIYQCCNQPGLSS